MTIHYSDFVSFIHCRKCLHEIPEDVTPAEWARINVGATKDGLLAAWCVRHDELIGIIDIKEIDEEEEGGWNEVTNFSKYLS